MSADALERLAVLQEAARALVAKMDVIHGDPKFENVWIVNQIRNGPYSGPTYEVELSALHAALHAADHDTPAPSGAPEIAEGARR